MIFKLLYRFEYSYLIQPIFKQIYLTHRMDSNRHNTPYQNLPRNNGNKVGTPYSKALQK